MPTTSHEFRLNIYLWFRIFYDHQQRTIFACIFHRQWNYRSVCEHNVKTCHWFVVSRGFPKYITLTILA